MLLVQDAQLLLLDEPVAGMSHEERDATGELLQRDRRGPHRRRHRARHGLHARVRAVRVTVLHAGKVLSEGTVAAGAGRPARAGGLPRARHRSRTRSRRCSDGGR